MSSDFHEATWRTSWKHGGGSRLGGRKSVVASDFMYVNQLDIPIDPTSQ